MPFTSNNRAKFLVICHVLGSSGICIPSFFQQVFSIQYFWPQNAWLTYQCNCCMFASNTLAWCCQSLQSSKHYELDLGISHQSPAHCITPCDVTTTRHPTQKHHVPGRKTIPWGKLSTVDDCLPTVDGWSQPLFNNRLPKSLTVFRPSWLFF